MKNDMILIIFMFAFALIVPAVLFFRAYGTVLSGLEGKKRKDDKATQQMEEHNQTPQDAAE